MTEGLCLNSGIEDRASSLMTEATQMNAQIVGLCWLQGNSKRAFDIYSIVSRSKQSIIMVLATITLMSII